MGITGLLPLLKDVQRERNVKDFAGQTLGIDAYVWLHRGAYGCAAKLAMGEFTNSYVKYAMTRIEMLRYHGVTPYVVFDGDRLPAKARTEADRETRRQVSRDMAKTLLEQGKKKQAHDVFAKCVDVTPEMAYQLIKALREAGVEYIVAPFEADAQLAYLEKSGVIAGVITEDSDLLVFGCKTVLYKLDIDGSCVEIKQERLTSSKALPLLGFTQAQFRQMAIMSGCDYLESVPGIGLKNAHRLLRKHNTVQKALQAARMEGKRLPASYAEDFATAERTFVYQRVFERSPDGSVRLVTLTSLDHLEAEERLLTESHECIGAPMPDEEARGIADGLVDPITRKPIVDLAPTATPVKQAFSSAVPKPYKAASSSTNKSALHKDPRQMGITGFFNKSSGSTTPRKPLTEKRENNTACKPIVVELHSLKRKFDDTTNNEAGPSKQRLVSPPSEVKSKFFAAPSARIKRRTASPGVSRATRVASPLSCDDAVSQERSEALPHPEDDEFLFVERNGGAAEPPSSDGVHLGFASPSTKLHGPRLSPFAETDDIISSPVTSLPDVDADADVGVECVPSSPQCRQYTLCDEEDDEMDGPIDLFESPSRVVRKAGPSKPATATARAPAPRSRSSSRISFDLTSDEEQPVVTDNAAPGGLSAKLYEKFAFETARPAGPARSSTTPNFRFASSKLDLRTPRSLSSAKLELNKAAPVPVTTVKRGLATPLSFAAGTANVTPKTEQQPLKRRGANVAVSTLKLRNTSIKTPLSATAAVAAAAARSVSPIKRSVSALEFQQSTSGSTYLQSFKYTPAAKTDKK